MIFDKKPIDLLQQSLTKQKESGKKNDFDFDESISGFEFQIRVADFDKYSFLIDDLRIRNVKNTTQLTLDDLKSQAQKLSTQITYLPEELKVVEIDQQNAKAQLLSKKPRTIQSARSYYEVILEKNRTVHLKRFQFDNDKKVRKQVPFQITQDILENLIHDLADAVNQ